MDNLSCGNRALEESKTFPRPVQKVSNGLWSQLVYLRDGKKTQRTGQEISYRMPEVELSFSDHVSDICKKASQKVGVLARLRNLISCETKLHLYLTAIIPNLTYCHTVWHFCKASDRRKLERVQERALRIIFNSKTDTYDALLSRAKLPSLHNRRLQDIAILMFKVKNGLVPDYIMDFSQTRTRAILLETLTSICLVSLQSVMENTPLDTLVLIFGQNWAQLTKTD